MNTIQVKITLKLREDAVPKVPHPPDKSFSGFIFRLQHQTYSNILVLNYVLYI